MHLLPLLFILLVACNFGVEYDKLAKPTEERPTIIDSSNAEDEELEEKNDITIGKEGEASDENSFPCDTDTAEDACVAAQSAFTTHMLPAIEEVCIGCHDDSHPEMNLSADSRSNLLQTAYPTADKLFAKISNTLDDDPHGGGDVSFALRLRDIGVWLMQEGKCQQ